MIDKPSSKSVDAALQSLRAGDCIGFPTETVYGLAADGLNAEAVVRIFEIKQRPSFDPLILHVAETYGLKQIVEEISPAAQTLIDAFWPGGLTLVFRRTPEVPDVVTSGLPTVAVRCPKHPIAQQILTRFQGPLAAPSANRFGRISPTSAEAVAKELGDKVPVIIDAGPCRIGVESTIVDCSEETPRLLRLGAVEAAKIESLVGPLKRPSTEAPPTSPGMLKHHYAPDIPLYLLEGNLPEDPKKWDGSAGYLLFEKKLPENSPITSRTLSPEGRVSRATANLFRSLRELQDSGIAFILAERVPERGLGFAVNDRLHKASSGTARWNGYNFEITDRAD